MTREILGKSPILLYYDKLSILSSHLLLQVSFRSGRIVIYAVNEKSSLYSNEANNAWIRCKRFQENVHAMKALALTVLIIIICIYPFKTYGFLK